MKQPELGKKLLELRQLKGVTQHEIAEMCHVSTRTIQRIELGKAEPRPMTLKLILNILGEDYETFMGSESKSSNPQRSSGFYLTASIAGALYFLLGFPEAYVDLTWADGHPDKLMFIIVKLLVMGSYAVFMTGFALLGKRLGLKVLEFSAYALIIATVGFYLASMGLVLSNSDPLLLGISESVTVGALSLAFGVALYQLRNFVGHIALSASILEVLIGFSLVLVVSFFIGLLLLIPATLVEIYLLYSASEKPEAEFSAAASFSPS